MKQYPPPFLLLLLLLIVFLFFYFFHLFVLLQVNPFTNPSLVLRFPPTSPSSPPFSSPPRRVWLQGRRSVPLDAIKSPTINRRLLMDLSVASNWFTVFRKVIPKDAFTFTRVLQWVIYYRLAKHGCKESPPSLTRTFYPLCPG